MKDHIERKFFDSFGIDPKINKTSAVGMSELEIPLVFPEITDRILLELICLLNTYGASYLGYRFKNNIKDLKHEILTDSIYSICSFSKNENKDNFKIQVRKLFGVEE